MAGQFGIAFSALPISIGVALLTYAIAFILRVKLPREWKVGDLALPPHKWVALLVILLILLRIGFSVVDYIDLKEKQTEVPPTDHSRFSIVVTDFAGLGGSEAADIIARQLQVSFGRSVQILRVPDRLPEAGYGDVLPQIFNSVLFSGYCAKHYDSDVVVWGTFSQISGTVELSNTVKGDRCFMPRCGLLFESPLPQAYALSDVGRDNSALQQKLASVGISKATLPMRLISMNPEINSCFKNIGRVHDYELKTDKLVAASPSNLSAEDKVQLFLADGAYHLFMSRLTHSPKERELALHLFQQVQTTNPAMVSEIAQPFALALLGKEQATNIPDERRHIALQISALPPSATDEGVKASLLRVKMDAWGLVYGLTQSEADYKLADHTAADALAVATDKESRFEIEVLLASLNLDRLFFGSNPPAYHIAAVAMNDARRVLLSLPINDRQSVPLSIMYRYYRNEVLLSELSIDLRYLASVTRDLFNDPRSNRPNWRDPNYVLLRKELSTSYFRAWKLTEDPTALSAAAAESMAVAENATDISVQAQAYYEAARIAEVAMPYSIGDSARSAAILDYRLSAQYFKRADNLKMSDAVLHNAILLDAMKNYTKTKAHPHCVSVSHPRPGEDSKICVLFSGR